VPSRNGGDRRIRGARRLVRGGLICLQSCLNLPSVLKPEPAFSWPRSCCILHVGRRGRSRRPNCTDGVFGINRALYPLSPRLWRQYPLALLPAPPALQSNDMRRSWASSPSEANSRFSATGPRAHRDWLTVNPVCIAGLCAPDLATPYLPPLRYIFVATKSVFNMLPEIAPVPTVSTVQSGFSRECFTGNMPPHCTATDTMPASRAAVMSPR